MSEAADISRIYRALRLIRRVEEEIARIYPSDKIRSPVHLSIGQESVAVGVCNALRDDDVVSGTYRGHALYLAKGGDLRAMGRRNGRAWRIGIRHPRRPGVIAGIDIDGDESVFTSGDYERFFEYQGVRYHHILDPETGYPAIGTVSLTVIASNGALADASATALFVAGPGEWPELAQALGIELVMLVAGDGHLEMTAAMARRVTLENPEELDIVIVDKP